MKTISCGDETFTPSKVICVGKNYEAHVREMGSRGGAAEPTIFLKPPTAVTGGGLLSVPDDWGLLHHEIELCSLIGQGGRDIAEASALDRVAGYAVGLDLTLRDRQAEAKGAGGPWTLAKGFDGAAPVGPFVPASDVPDPQALELVLQVNGEERQRGSTADMLFPIATLIAFVSRFMTIEAGDLLMTGTPAGVGPLAEGDRLHAEITGLPPLDLRIERPA